MTAFLSTRVFCDFMLRGSKQHTPRELSKLFLYGVRIRRYVAGKPTQGKYIHSVELTQRRYPSIKRKPFNVLNDSDIKFFESLLPQRVVTDQQELESFNVDWLKTCRGESRVLLKPRNVEEVSDILKYCSRRHLAVVPQGGNTGLSGGSVPVFDEIILSSTLMNKIISFDDLSGTIECQSGCVLETLETHANQYGLSMPLDLGAKGSCHIGGNVATNAGGLRFLRYGSLHGNVLGLQAVLADGTVVDCMSTLRKDNTGYDVKQLFIGSEGTLGVITAVSLQCVPKGINTQVAFLGCETFDRVKEVYRHSKASLGEILSAFEFLDEKCIEAAQKHLGLRSPISPCAFYVLIETSGSDQRHDEEKLNVFLEKMIDEGVVNDGTMATDASKIQSIWSLRENMAEAMLHDGYNYKYDVSLPLSHFYDIVGILRERLRDRVTSVVGYGHIGDGNLHINITTPEYDDRITSLLEPFIYDWVSAHSGSVSAEHGLGFKKTDYIYHSNSREAVSLMKAIKHLLDPQGILNPYKVFPPTER